MLDCNAKKHIFVGWFVVTIIRRDILDVGYIYSSDGENIGRMIYRVKFICNNNTLHFTPLRSYSPTNCHNSFRKTAFPVYNTFITKYSHLDPYRPCRQLGDHDSFVVIL